MEDEILDVIEDDSSHLKTESDKEHVESESDKEKNFERLRKRNEELEAENKRLKGNGTEKDSKPGDFNKTLFQRDLKAATIRWNKEHNVPDSELEKIKGKINFNGDEVVEEILEKMTEAYESLPEVKSKKEKDIALKAKAEALKEFTGQEMDLGSGGGEPSGTEEAPKFNSKTKRMLDAFNVPEKVRKTIKP